MKKSKKKPGDIIILHMCTINDNYMMCVFWDMERGGHIFLSFWTIFWPFTSLKSRKIKILKKWKKRLEISSLYTNVPKIMTKCYTVPVIRCVTDAIIILYLRLFLPFYPPNNPKNQNLKKKKERKTAGYIIILYMCTKNNDEMMHGFWDMLRDGRTDRRTDGRAEKVTYRGGCSI